MYLQESQPEPTYWARVPWLVAQVHPDLPGGRKHRTYIYLLPDCPTFASVSIHPPAGRGAA